MKSMNATKLMKILKAHEFFLVRQKGSHMIWKNTNGIMVPIPLHDKTKQIPLGTFLAIVKQSKILKEKFR